MKPITYTRFTQAERAVLSQGLAAGQSLRTIAQRLGRSPSTCSREVRRAGRCRMTYQATAAQRHAQHVGTTRRRLRKLHGQPRLRAYVVSKLGQAWSPAQIARRLVQAYPTTMTMRIAPTTIYAALTVWPRGHLRRELHAVLRCRTRRARRRYLRPHHLATAPSIDQRPAQVRTRQVAGHWEGDLLIGPRQASALGTLVERTTRYTLLVPLTQRSAPAVRRAFAAAFLTLPAHLRQTLTYDRGSEMAEYQQLTATTAVRVFFAHPHSPWERGTNENTNGLLRQFFPKGTDFRRIEAPRIAYVQRLLNGRPRQVLNWQTPQELMDQLLR